MLYALLFELFVLPRKIAIVEIPISSKIDPENMPSVTQHA
jgi:hypothetical protein